MVDYSGLASNADLTAFLKSVAEVPAEEVAGWTRSQKIAFYSNAYNAYTFQTILEANGGTLENVVKVTSFVTDLREAAASGEVRRKYFQGGFPASTQVQCAALGTPDLKIEIEAIAVLPD